MKPLLSASKLALPKDITLPTYASIKLDGIRCCMVNGVATSRNEKPIPNQYVQDQLKGLHGFDGELILRDPNKDFNDCQSAFMGVDGSPDFVYMIFDMWDRPSNPFTARVDEVVRQTLMLKHPRVEMIEQRIIYEFDQLVEYYNKIVGQGHEGIICRSPNGRYKYGRSTMKEQFSIKLKPVKEAEATVIGFLPLVDKAGVTHNTLGAIQCRMNGVEFQLGTGLGLTAHRRKQIWHLQKQYIGQQVSFQYQELSKAGVPRFPSWRGFRYDRG